MPIQLWNPRRSNRSRRSPQRTTTAPEKDFRSLFRETATKVLGEIDEEGSKPDAEPADEPDEQIPDNPDDDADDTTADADDPDKAKDPEKAEGKQPDARTRKYKDVVAQNEQLQAQKDRLDTLEKSFEQHGGLDVVETAIQMYEKLATEPVKVLEDLPKHQREQFVRDVFSEALANEGNRVFGINSVLKTEFGLTSDLTQPQMEKVFEYVASRFTEDPADFEAFLDRELDFRNTPERENARLKAELERQKAKPADQPSDPAQSESQNDFVQRVEKSYTDIEDRTFENVASPKFAEYGLNVTPKDSAEIREAKELLVAAVRSNICEQMRSAKAFEPLIPYIASGDTENKFYSQAESAYGRAMKAKVETALKTVSRLINKAQPAPADIPAGDSTTTAKPRPAAPRIPAPGGKSNLPAPAPKQNQSGGFRNAFGSAKRAIGS
jgi:hypothetical protein